MNKIASELDQTLPKLPKYVKQLPNRKDFTQIAKRAKIAPNRIRHFTQIKKNTKIDTYFYYFNITQGVI